MTLRSRADLRGWLEVHHGQRDSVWLVTFKRPHPDHLIYPQIVEELLCWGWIDSVPRTLDADRSMLLASPRREQSAWSAVNKAHVERAVASGAMTAAGLAKVAAAKANGQWEFLDDVDRLEVPDDLAAMLGDAGRRGWDVWPRSVKRGTLEWIKTAKSAPTRLKRVQDVADSIAKGVRPSPYRR